MTTLLVDRIKERTKTLGPGTRAAIWFHGCHRHCQGCIAAEMNLSKNYDSFSVDVLVGRIRSLPDIEGVTISGGEPFDQDLASMFMFLQGVRASGLTVMAYTGYTREDLEADVQKRSLLALVDILVDGPYLESEDHGELWRGSGNQRIHFLTDRYCELRGKVESAKGRTVEVDLDEGRGFSFSGIPPRGFRERLERSLQQRGLEIEW